MHVTPGAFSAYRKEFFERYGGYDEENITEDMEIALRIQKHHYVIENAPKAVVYTIAPFKFRELMIQRKRWYTGSIKNFLNYYELFERSYGVMGVLILPLAILTIFSTIFLTLYTFSKSISSFRDEMVSLAAINFDFNNFFEFSKFAFNHYICSILSQPVFVIFLVFVAFLSLIMLFSKFQTKFKDPFGVSLILFILSFSLLFSLWWIVSFFYLIFNRKIVWRETKHHG
jgi:cellulose synthase/poly-beta-1,6-N-acetylglucosamine synthase-like glycosyltransferase